jgi:hypothetical protein
MIHTQDASVLSADEYAIYATLNKLSVEYGYASQKTFARVVEAIQKNKKVAIRTVAIGKRIKFNRLDIQNLLT